MALIRWHGITYKVKLIEQKADGSWIAQALEHGSRFALGTHIHVLKNEIVSMDDAPGETASDVAQLETAMAEERKTLPSVYELLAKSKKDTPDAPAGT